MGLDRAVRVPPNVGPAPAIPACMVARVILLGLLLAQLGDAATFMVGEALHGIGLESNGFAVAVLALIGPRYPRLLVWGGAAATGIGLLGLAANLTSLLLLAG
jgi:hypothetical protein